MTTKRQQEALARMTPEQRAAVEAIRARHRTPEAQADHERIAAETRQAHPPIETDDTLAAFVAGLKLARERAELSLSAVAERTGLDRTTVHRLESGKLPNPTWSTLRAIAAAVGYRVVLDLARDPAGVGR
jgi:DNA-binding XRE family transcriptional regulator